MMRKSIFLILIIIISIISFSDNIYDEFSEYSKLQQFKVTIKMKFEVDATPTSIFLDLYVDNYKYYYFEIHEPEILSGIGYYYDYHKDKFYTELNGKPADSYDNIKQNLKVFINFIKVLSVSYTPEKFIIKKIETDNYNIYYFYPKTKNLLRLMRVDYTQLKIYMKKIYNTYYAEKMEFYNSNNKKKVEVYFNFSPMNTDFIKEKLLSFSVE
ncbi:hypothetical protein XO10_09450 [Marinitoga sp. 1135]|uniref:Outer membrane lipoprotein-sorting protein n=1 Tax=Marinitoga piezophila (strain DSM 14283 / JCM 11233 / KA3) TaxID=443254 RepID=H2J6E5_MARPK|nr:MULTISPECIES: hypothetical protein [Marinitoga]AEX86293.1 hypothetical protein Marpi_1913 [Marinitoga piezophila KA3]APT76698.1 hypothetical protein LN42_10145 [Marinitoga sp. 1137]NUU96476.1 hypothetical protein [Marinitoga sp. 1135]NUU98396.1 hypothetical protein [Marinitoga sp. 1138]